MQNWGEQIICVLINFSDTVSAIDIYILCVLRFTPCVLPAWGTILAAGCLHIVMQQQAASDREPKRGSLQRRKCMIVLGAGMFG